MNNSIIVYRSESEKLQDEFFIYYFWPWVYENIWWILFGILILGGIYFWNHKKKKF